MFVKLEGRGHLGQRLYRGIRRAILDGRLAPGARLPSTRTLSTELGLSRNVVVEAFQQLLDEGYVDSRTGSGTYVSQTLPDALLAPWRARKRPAPRPRKPPLSAQAARVLALEPLPPPGRSGGSGLQYDFQYGVPALADFPHQEWSRIASRRARSVTLASLRYGRVLGIRPLREAIADHAARSRGVAAGADRVIVVNGTQQGLDLIARCLLAPGDRVVVEEPCYQAARQVFQAAGARIHPAPVDEQGLDTSRLPLGVEAKLAYVTPSHQFPLGGILPLPRRLELLRWAERAGCYVVEDDYDSEFRYRGRPVEAVQGLDRAGRVLYAGTFSKVLFPALRIGYLIVPESFVRPIAALRFLADCHSPTFEQTVLAEFIAEGHFERHLRRSRERNRSRRAALMEAVEKYLGDAAEVAGENAGVHVVLWLRHLEWGRLDALIASAAARGLGIYSLAPYYLRPPPRAGLLLGYANLREREIREGIALLARVLRES